jgi:hypothetical protein
LRIAWWILFVAVVGFEVWRWWFQIVHIDAGVSAQIGNPSVYLLGALSPIVLLIVCYPLAKTYDEADQGRVSFPQSMRPGAMMAQTREIAAYFEPEVSKLRKAIDDLQLFEWTTHPWVRSAYRNGPFLIIPISIIWLFAMGATLGYNAPALCRNAWSVTLPLFVAVPWHLSLIITQRDRSTQVVIGILHSVAVLLILDFFSAIFLCRIDM